MALKTYLYISLAVVISVALIWAYGQWQDYQTLKFEHSVTLQNTQAYKDSVTVLAGKYTILASQVYNLTAENNDLKGKVIALQVDNQSLITQLNAHGSGTTALTDTSADVNFKDSVGIAHFTGQTHVDLRSKLSNWNLIMTFDPINTKAVLFKDVDGLWKLKTTSLTDGVLVKGESSLDDATFAALQKYEPPVPPKNFGLRGQFTTVDAWGGFIFRYSDRWYIDGSYRVIHPQPKLIDNLQIGVSFFLF
jgi:hypothetical protein